MGASAPFFPWETDMVISKNKSIRNMVLFIFPALVFYIAFFGLPFLQGIGFSFMRWDGASQQFPPSFTSQIFETEILPLAGEKEKTALLEYYQKSPEGQYIRKVNLSWNDESILKETFENMEWENPNYRWIGLGNYLEIFTNTDPNTGEKSQSLVNFFPRTFIYSYFKLSSQIKSDTEFEAGPFENLFLANLTQEDLIKAEEAFRFNSETGKYVPKEEWQEPVLTRDGGLKTYLGQWSRERFDISKTVVEFGKTADREGFLAYLSEAPWYASSEGENLVKLQEITDKLYVLGELKVLLAENMQEERLNMGVLLFTIFFTVFNVLLTNLAAFLIAMALDQKIRTKNALRSVFFLPNILALIVVAYIWNLVFAHVLGPMFGVDEWMADTNKAPWLVVLVSVWQGAGYLMVIYLAGMQSIPGEIMEAAAVDGASGFRKVWSIILPLLLPAFTICLFLSISNSLKAFDLIYILNGGSTGYSYGTVPFVMDIYQDYYAQQNAGMASAKAILLMIVILIITGLQLNIMKKREVEY
jgi:raffinose/stachyose/melibiose transport system permease protein